MRTAKGAIIWVGLEIDAVYNGNSFFEFRLVIRNVTEHKEAEARQIEHEAQMRRIEKADSLQRMGGAIAHLFNNQFQVILGNLEMLLSDTPEDTTAQQYISCAMQAARRSAEVSGLLLTYLGQGSCRSELLDLSAVCRDHIAGVQADLPAVIALETDFLPEGPIVQAYPAQLQQILTNLIQNSCEAIGGESGRISVATKTIKAAAIPAGHVVPTDWQSTAETFACLEVTDSGCGMTAEQMNRIFDPFFSTRFTGRGLGLAVVSGLAESWNGMVGVTSTAGKGSTLRVFLPLRGDMLPRQPVLPAEPCDLTAGWTVLLVDDDAGVRDMAAALLKRIGLTVLAASGGKDAVALLREHHAGIDCLITDLSMPGMDGWQTLAALRLIRPELPAILSSGYDEAQVMCCTQTEQPQAFLHKPYSKAELRDVLCGVLSGAIPRAA